MTTTDRTCAARCRNGGVPRTGLMICRGCINHLESDLKSCETTRQELVVTLAGMDRIGAATEGHAKKVEVPGSDEWLKARPYDARASHALHELRNELTTWVRLIADETGDPLPHNRIATLAAWLGDRIDYIAKHEAAGELARGIKHVLKMAEKAVDLPLDKAKIKVGPCPEREPSDTPDEFRDGMSYCPGTIYAYIPQDASREYRPCLLCTHEACGHETHEWTAEQWARMGRRIQKRMGIEAKSDDQAIRRLVEAVTA